MNSGIYKWTNKINGKIYIGQAINLNNRMRAFLSFKIAYAGKLINEERKKYPSLKYWDYEILEECDEEKLDEMEIKYIKEIPLEKSLNFEYCHKQHNAVIKQHLREIKRKRKQILSVKVERTVIHLEIGGEHHYFGSIANMYEYFTPQQLGISYGALRNYGLSDILPYSNSKCVIRKGQLLSKSGGRGRKKIINE